MKTVYLDTSVYNRILDDPRRYLIIRVLAKAYVPGTLQVLFSINNFEEFCHTRDVDRRTQLFKLAYSICKHQFVMSAGELIKRELEAYADGRALTKYNIYNAADFEGIFAKAVNGTLFEGAPNELFEEMRRTKCDDLKFEKNSKKQLGPLWEGHRDIPFDKFYQSSLTNEEANTWLRRVCVGCFGETGEDKQDFSNLNLERLPGLRCLFKHKCGVMWKQILKGEKPEWGSRLDMYHSVFVGYCDIFVTGDNNFLDVVNLFGESKVKCLSFSEFVAQYMDATIQE